MSVLHRATESALTADSPSGGDSASASTPSAGRRAPLCPECRQPFKKVHPRQLFCSTEHKATFHNRATVRGRMLTPVVIAARITRNGCTGDKEASKRARRESSQLMDAWAREDREAGRMSMLDYMNARWRIGY